MVIRILTFMKIQVGKTLDVINTLLLVPQVKEIFYITGDYDLAVRIEGNSPEELHDTFVSSIDPIPNILNSNSHFLIKEFSKELLPR